MIVKVFSNVYLDFWLGGYWSTTKLLQRYTAIFFQWKQLKSGKYVCGFEPPNSVNNRKDSRKDKTLQFIKPGQKIDYIIRILIIDDINKINSFINK